MKPEQLNSIFPRITAKFFGLWPINRVKKLSQTAGWKTLSNYLLPIVIAFIFLVFTYFYFPFREKIQFDGDEGLNLMRSMLVEMGHPLYIEVSSDQPPLFTQILALLMHLVGYVVSPARLLALLFSTMLVLSCAQFLQLTWGKLAAILFLPLVIVAPRFLVLSVSVMIGLPSIALATVSMLCITFWHKNKNNLWLILSGFALALSVLIKLFSGFLVPIFLIGITLEAYSSSKGSGISWKMLRPALIWSICFVSLTVFLVLVLVGPQNIWQIIYPHIASVTEKTYQEDNFTINNHLELALPLLFVSLFGVFFITYKHNWLTFYPFSWAILAYALLSIYSPVLYHHQLLITIPAAIIAAAGVSEGIHYILDSRRLPDLFRFETLIGIAALISFVLIVINYVPILNESLRDEPKINGFALQGTAGKIKVINTMNEYIGATHWIVTDMPMYAFIVKRPVPPILATFSRKRLVTGSLTAEDVLTAVRDYQPEQVLMARFVIPGLETYLKKDYTLVVSPEYFQLFVRNDIIKQRK